VRAWVIGKHLIDQTIVGSEIMLASEKSEESLFGSDLQPKQLKGDALRKRRLSRGA